MTDLRAEARNELAHRWGATTLAEAAAQEAAAIAYRPPSAPPDFIGIHREIAQHVDRMTRNGLGPATIAAILQLDPSTVLRYRTTPRNTAA